LQRPLSDCLSSPLPSCFLSSLFGKQLNVSINNLGLEGGKAIAASIADNSSITSVSNFSMLFLETFRGRDSHEITVS
jgi:hypothetical protein